jgi:hypothetical protein
VTGQENQTHAGRLPSHLSAERTCRVLRDLVRIRSQNPVDGACDIPCVVLGPGDEAQAHQPDEHMDVAQLDQGARASALAALAACGAGA